MTPGGQLTRSSACRCLLPGITVSTSPTDFYPVQAVQLQRFKGETWELFGDDHVTPKAADAACDTTEGRRRPAAFSLALRVQH